MNSAFRSDHFKVSQQEPRTEFEVLLSQIDWMWGAEMGANECGVVIGPSPEVLAGLSKMKPRKRETFRVDISWLENSDKCFCYVWWETGISTQAVVFRWLQQVGSNKKQHEQK